MAKSEAVEDVEIEKPEKAEGPGVEVELDDDDDEPEVAATPDLGRQEKRRERGNLRREVDQLKLAAAEREAAHERRLNEIQQNIYQSRQPATPQEFPEDKELADVEVANQVLIERWNALGARATDDDRKKFTAEAHKLDERKFEARAAKRDRLRAPTQQQMQAQQRTNALTAQYSDVFAHPKAAGFAIRRMQDAIDDGHPDNPETVAEVMKQARAKYGIGGRRPDPTMSRKLSGMPASGGGRGGPTKLHLTEVEKGMADALYGKSIPDDEARWKHYARTIAVKAREEEG